ncbi:MAG: 3-dehydroquinate synthase [Bryobacteraceae bacterium]
MPVFHVKTAQRCYPAVVERGALARLPEFLPPKHGKVFVVTEEQVWRLHGAAVNVPHELLMLAGGEERKRLAPLEQLAGEMVQRGGDRSSIVVAFGGGIVTDMGGFLAAIFMRGVPVIQVPTTLLAQVDAGLGGKTGVNLACGKNLIGAFHQPLAVLADPAVLATLPEREYRAGLYEIVKAGIIRVPELFEFLVSRRGAVLAREPEAVERIIADAVRMKAEVVSADERESDVRRILNFGHTFGHSLEAETGYARFLHGEAVAFGMQAATHLAARLGLVNAADAEAIRAAVRAYGPIPTLEGIAPERLAARLVSDKKTVQGHVHFVLPVRIGEVTVAADVDPAAVLEAIRAACA